jgi:anti-anti-sigma factor
LATAQITLDAQGRAGEPLIWLAGDISYSLERELAQALTAAEQSATATVFVEASGLSFIDSTGLRALLVAVSDLARRSKRLVIVAPTRQFRRLIEITGLTELLPCEVVPDP